MVAIDPKRPEFINTQVQKHELQDEVEYIQLGN